MSSICMCLLKIFNLYRNLHNASNKPVPSLHILFSKVEFTNHPRAMLSYGESYSVATV